MNPDGSAGAARANLMVAMLEFMVKHVGRHRDQLHWELEPVWPDRLPPGRGGRGRRTSLPAPLHLTSLSNGSAE